MGDWSSDVCSSDLQSYLGFMFENGHGVPRDQLDAVNWYRRAAEENDIKGQYFLGRM